MYWWKDNAKRTHLVIVVASTGAKVMCLLAESYLVHMRTSGTILYQKVSGTILFEVKSFIFELKTEASVIFLLTLFEAYTVQPLFWISFKFNYIAYTLYMFFKTFRTVCDFFLLNLLTLNTQMHTICFMIQHINKNGKFILLPSNKYN